MKKTDYKKYHGLHNDFLLLDGRTTLYDHKKLKTAAPQWCNRNTPYKGADGILLVELSQQHTLKMTIWNADGSQPEMCGNAIRCIGLWAAQHNLVTTENPTLSVETLGGPQYITLLSHTQTTAMVKVDMGPPIWDPSRIPVALETNPINYTYTYNGKTIPLNFVSMGNPHAVIFMTDNTLTPNIDGPNLETADLFPNKANIEFVTIKSPSEADVIVWERGVGLTQACGTGACAVVATGIRTQQLQSPCTINLPGGSLHIEQSADQHMIMTGPAEYVGEGSLTFGD